MKESNIDHPSYYNEHPSGVECIDIIEPFSFNLGCVIKYIWRAGLKRQSPLPDLKKALWYLKREIDRLDERIYENKSDGKRRGN